MVLLLSYLKQGSLVMRIVKQNLLQQLLLAQLLPQLLLLLCNKLIQPQSVVINNTIEVTHHSLR